MLLPPEVFSADLTSAEFKTVIAMYQVANNGIVTATTAELSEMTGYSTETLRRAFRGLEDKGLLTTTRTKRNLGKFYYNIYRLMVAAPPLEPVGLTEVQETSPSLVDVGSTHDYLPNQSIATGTQLLTTVSKTHYVRLTPARDARRLEKGNPKMVNRFVDDFDGGGVGGLLPDEVTAKDEPWRTSSAPNSLKTAREFADRLRKANPMTPGLVNTRKLSILLSKYRKDHKIPYEVEKAIVELWFEDARNSDGAESLVADRLMGKFLNFYRQNLRAGYAVAGIPWPDTDTSATVVSPVSAGTALYASDGSPFPDTPGGQKHLAEYEAKIRRRNQ